MLNRGKSKNKLLEKVRNVWNDKKMLRIVFVSMFLMAVCISVSVVHLLKVNNLYRGLYKNNISETLEVVNEDISRDIEAHANFLATTSATFSAINDFHRYTICDTLEAVNTTDMFNDIYFVHKKNSLKYTRSGNVSNTDYSFYTSNGKSGIDEFYMFHDPESEDPSEVTYVYPVFVNGVEIGLLVGVDSAQNRFKSAFSTDKTTQVAETFIVKNSGYILADGDQNTRLVDCIGKNFYTDVLVDVTGSEVSAAAITEEMMLSLYDNYSGNVEFHGGLGESGYISYSEISNTADTLVVFLLFNSEMNKIMRPMLIESIITIMSLVVIMLIMFTIISRYAGAEQEKIHNLAYVDDLTNAPNVNAFKERARALLEDNEDLPYIVVSFDIQNFRYINEGYGHEKADVVLKALSRALQDSYTYNETFARVNADRFIALAVDDGRNAERIEFIDGKIREATSNILLNYPIKIKTGIYFVKNKKEDVSSMMDKADLARKSIKSDSRGDLKAEYEDRLMEETRKRENIESRMEMALSSGEFVPFLQPKWNMAENKICGAEALIRWINPDGSIVPPGDFIPLFETNGFIEKVDFYMLERICAYIRKMLDEGREVFPISVNQSRFLMHDPEYVTKVKEILIKYKIPKHLIELEITETVFTYDKEHMLEVMNQLREFNVELSMDDFGSGYSSLSLLRDIPLDVLKIDRGFLDESSQSDSGRWILNKIVEMAEGLHLRVICEGVETEEHEKMLLDIGCIFAQGFKYSRPIPMSEFIEKYNIIKA